MSYFSKTTSLLIFLLSLIHFSVSATTYYSKSAGNLNTLATWGTATNGTGAAPPNFTTAGNTFIIANNAAPTISANWTVSGAGSKVLVGDGVQAINFIVPSPRTITATFSVMVNSTLTAASGCTISASTVNVNGSFVNQTNNNPTLGILAAGSTVTYSRAGNQTVTEAAYYNLTLGGSGRKSLANVINSSVTNMLTINSGVSFKLNTVNTLTFTLNGTLTGTGTIRGSTNSNLSIGGTGNLGTLNFTVGAQSLYKFTLNRASSGNVTLGSALTVANAFTHTNGIFNLNGKTLTLNGAITFPVSATNGSFSGSSTTSLSIAGSGTILNSLFMTQTGTANYLNNITLNRTAQSLSLGNTLNLVGTLTPTAGTFASVGNLNLIATSYSVTARIGTIGASGSVTGNVKVQMYAKGGTTGWTTMGSPGLTSRSFSDWDDNIIIQCANCPDGWALGFTSVQWYDETAGGLYNNALRYKTIANISDPMTIGKGFWVYLGTGTGTTADIVLDATGPVNQGNFSINLTETNSGGGTQAADHGYNLISNPYPSPISWTALLGGNVNVANAIYVYNPDNAGYATYVNNVSSPTGPTGIGDLIPAGQAFLVKANAAAVTLTALETNKSASTQALLRPSGAQQVTSSTNPMVLRLKASGLSMQFETAMYFDANATSNYEDAYDASYLGVDNGHLGIATSIGGYDYAINGLPALNQNFSIPVKVTTGTTGTYQIAAGDIQNLPGGACVILHDNYTNTDQDLRSGPYSCTVTDTETVARFVLNITINNSLSVTGITNDPTCSSSANGSIIASGSGAGPWNYYWKDANNNIIKTSLNKVTADTLSAVGGGNYSVDVNTVGTCDNGTRSFTLQGTTVSNSSFNPSATSVVLMQDTVSVHFTNTSSNANTYWWDFGDGNGSADTNTVNYYASPGDYTVTLTAYNSACGDSTVSTQVITVVDGIVNGITAYAEPTKNMFISRDERGYYVQFGYATKTNAVVTVQNILGEQVTGNLNEKNVSKEKVYIPLGNTENKILIISVVTETGEKTFCKVINY